MNIRITTIVLGTLAFFSTTCFAQGGKVTIKHEWPSGVYLMTQTSKSTSDQTVGTQAIKSLTNETMVWELRIGEPNAKGEKKITAKVVKYKFNEEGDTPSSYDSEQPAGQQNKDNAFVYGPLVGAPLEISLDSDDAVVEVSGLDKLWKELSARAATNEQKGRLAQASLELADKTIEQALRRTESIVPKKAVTTGEKWSAGIRSDLPLIGEVKQRYDCSLKTIEQGPSGKLAVVQMEGRYEATKPKAGTIQGQEITVSKMDVTEKGDVKFDLDTGIAAVDEKTVDVSAVLDAADENGKPMRVQVKGHNEVKTTIAPAEGASSGGAGKVESPAAADPSGQAVTPGGGGSGVQKMLKGMPPKESAPEQKPGPSSSSAPVSYVTYRYIDQGGLRDQATGQWLEAFSILMPAGWRFEGGLRWVANEKRADQLSKTDALMPVKSDYSIKSPDGRYVLRSYPAEYWVDTSRTQAQLPGVGFKTGQNYNGMIVSPVVTPEQYISSFVCPRQRGQVNNLKVVQEKSLPKLAELYAAESARFNQMAASTHVQGSLDFKAGTITIDYDEGQTPYRETFIALIQYMDTAGMVMFWPRMNFSFRAPREEFDRLQPVFTTVAASVQNNPRWSVHLIKLTRRSAISQREMDEYCHKIQREIAASHSATTSELARDMGYLVGPYHSYKGTDGNRYYLPTDKYHFMNAKGELLSQDSWVSPSSDWKSIEPYNQ